MTTFSENIRKLMGWCPNVSTIETRKSVQFDGMMVNTPGSEGELTYTTAGFWNKYHNRILLNAVILTLVAMTYYISYGRYNPDNFRAGIIYGLIVSIFTGITEWRRLNKAAAGDFKKVCTRKKKIMNYLIIFGFIIVVMIIVGFIAAKTDIRISGIYATLSGFILFVWTQYLEVVYWERKNRKTLIVEKTSFYAVGGSK